jgi:hypothetical protein
MDTANQKLRNAKTAIEPVGEIRLHLQANLCGGR